ncbi:MAG: amidase [Acidimicrobiaceae bacterium]|nr:amidase [Acidimicrobiaceae bacterium]
MTDIESLLDSADATDVAAAVRSGAVDAVELVEAAIGRIEERNPQINAVIATCFDDALENARNVDRDAPFAGVPFVVKDCRAQVAGVPETWGSRLMAEVVPDEDSELTKRYRAAGFVILGVTNMPEMGKQGTTEPAAYGPTRNPYDLTKSPGGSSGGTGAAVASGMVPIGHGNDGGGSIRVPSAACGLFGLKPSRGRVTGHPAATMMSYPMGIDHVMTRSVRDSAHVLDLTAGPVVGDPYQIATPGSSWLSLLEQDPGKLRIGVASRSMEGPEFEPACAAALERAVGCLEGLGHELEVADFPVDPGIFTLLGGLMAAATKVMIDDRLSELGRGLQEADLEPFTRYIYDLASGFDGADVIRGLQAAELVGRRAATYFSDFDVFLSPTTRTVVPELGVYDTSNLDTLLPIASTPASETAVFNTSGQPAASVPMGYDDSGVPLGVQVAALFGREDLVLSVARQMEQTTPWSTHAVWPARSGASV